MGGHRLFLPLVRVGGRNFNMKTKELIAEIDRVKDAIRKSESPKLRKDYGKYLKRLYKEAGINGRKSWSQKN